MARGVRIIKHETVPQYGSYEVRFTGPRCLFIRWVRYPTIFDTGASTAKIIAAATRVLSATAR